MVEREEAVIARQRHAKHLSMVMNMLKTTEDLLEAVFSTQSTWRL
jgi:hypothetical protein